MLPPAPDCTATPGCDLATGHRGTCLTPETLRAAKDANRARRNVDGYDRVYFWAAIGTEGYAWHEAVPFVYPDRLSVDELVTSIEKAGRIAVRGRSTIGPPDGPPRIGAATDRPEAPRVTPQVKAIDGMAPLGIGRKKS